MRMHRVSMKIITLITLLVIVGMIPIASANHPDQFIRDQDMLPSRYVNDCISSGGWCVQEVKSKYAAMVNQYHSFWHNYTDTITKQETTIAHLQGEVHVWQSKYNHLLAQQGNSTIQDKVANLTDRMDAVETKAATNESLIYIIQNMLRTVQTDIEDIYLKINSVR